MALKVWLPLNKDLRNVGLSNNKAIGYSTSFSASGPYYNSAVFKGSNYIDINYDMSNKEEFTIAMFVYCTGTTFDGNLFTVEKNTYWQFIVYYGTLQWRDDVIGYNGTRKSITLPTVVANSWNHLCITFNKGTVTVYLNGAKKSTISGDGTKLNSGISHFWIGHCGDGYWFRGLVSDFRLYDNAISENDIYRIFETKTLDITPYKISNRKLLFDRSGFMLKHFSNSDAKYYSNSIYFNGTNQKITSKEDGFESTDGTLSIWFKPKITSPPVNNCVLYIDGNSKMACGLYDNNTFFIISNKSYTPMYQAYKINYGSWNHICITYDGNVTYCFLNGSNMSSSSQNFWSNIATDIKIGGNSDNYYKGNISNIKVYNSPLKENEILKLYNEGLNDFIPDKYEELEYIQSNGNQWINSEIIMKLSIKIDCIFQTANAGSYLLYGTSNTNAELTAWGMSSGYNWRFGHIAPSPMPNYTPTIINHVVQDKNGIIINNVKQSTYSGSFTFTNSKPIYIFGSPEETSYGKATMKLYSFKMYDNDILVRNFIPSKRKSDNVIGMYDMVSRQFFTNDGSDSFTGE